MSTVNEAHTLKPNPLPHSPQREPLHAKPLPENTAQRRGDFRVSGSEFQGFGFSGFGAWVSGFGVGMRA